MCSTTQCTTFDLRLTKSAIASRASSQAADGSDGAEMTMLASAPRCIRSLEIPEIALSLYAEAEAYLRQQQLSGAGAGISTGIAAVAGAGAASSAGAEASAGASASAAHADALANSGRDCASFAVVEQLVPSLPQERCTSSVPAALPALDSCPSQLWLLASHPHGGLCMALATPDAPLLISSYGAHSVAETRRAARLLSLFSDVAVTEPTVVPAPNLPLFRAHLREWRLLQTLAEAVRTLPPEIDGEIADSPELTNVARGCLELALRHAPVGAAA
eukprot:2363081-Pleurochrysis_carterae.AAC.2